MTAEREVVFHFGGGPVIDLVRLPTEGGGALHWLELQQGHAGVVVIPTDGELMLLQRQWRHTVGEHVWQFPRGFGEGDASADAARELGEETGIRRARFRTVGRLFPDPGILASTVMVVEAKVERFPKTFAPEPQHGEPAESIDNYATVTAVELDRWIADGVLVDGITLAALQLWRASVR